MSGTTRDAIDTELTMPDGKRFTLIDTAGIRKRTAVASSDDGAEPLSVNRALQAIRQALTDIGQSHGCDDGAEPLSVNRILQAIRQALTDSS